MTYRGRVEHGVIILDGPTRPPEGTIVRVEEESTDSPVGQTLDLLAGQAQALPPTLPSTHDQTPQNVWAMLDHLAGSVQAPVDWAAEHDHYLYGTPKRSANPAEHP